MIKEVATLSLGLLVLGMAFTGSAVAQTESAVAQTEEVADPPAEIEIGAVGALEDDPCNAEVETDCTTPNGNNCYLWVEERGCVYDT